MEPEILKNLNEAQKKAVSHLDGPLLIVAGAGTGKTTVITSKIAWLIMEQGIKPEEVLALTFTEKSAAEMEERIDQLLPLGYTDLWVSTFHSFAERILRNHALEIGLPADFKLLNDTGQWMLIRKNLDRFQLDYYRPLSNPTKFIQALLKLFSRAKDEEASPESYLDYIKELKNDTASVKFLKTFLSEKEIENLSTAETKALIDEEIIKQQEIAGAYQTYQQLLLENNCLDFGDLINYLLKLFKTRKSILARYRAQFKYIMVDEFQDTNWAQYELIKLLAEPKNNLMVVGDDDQSIYKFRGASISNILQFKDDFPESEEILLVDNYRSSQNILDLAYNFIQRNNPNRLEVKLKEQGKDLSKKLTSHLEQSGTIEHLLGQTIDDEVGLVIKKMIELYNQDQEIKWSDFAILVRANNSADNFIKALELAGLPFIFLASKGLYRQPLILDILSWLRCLDNYHEGSAMYRVLNFNHWQLNHLDLIKLNYLANRKGFSLYEICQQEKLEEISEAGRKVIESIIKLMDEQSDLAKQGIATSVLFRNFLDRSGYLKTVAKTDSKENREAVSLIDQFYKKILDFEKNSEVSRLEDFMELINLELEAGESGTLKNNLEDLYPDSIKISTVHSAKGLEFKYVFITNLVDRKFPSDNRSELLELPEKLIREKIPEGDIHLQEERRLFYVAVTRAKEGLFFSSALDCGGARLKKPSRFLIELSEDGFNLSTEPFSFKGLSEPKEEQLKNKITEPTKDTRKDFSFTQLEAYKKCPYQYRFAHILKIPTDGSPASSFGKSMHAVMEKFFILAQARQRDNLVTTITWPEVEKIYEDSFIDDWYPNREIKEEYYQKGLVSLKTFFEKWQKEPQFSQHLEYKFSFKLKPDCLIKGSVDRIDQTSTGLKLIDYKTGSAKEKINPDQKEQLLIYQLAMEALLQEKVAELTFYYLENNSELTFIGKPVELEKLRAKIIERVEKIRAGEFPPAPDKEKCKWCDFKNICDFAIL
jgi:DNA helicase II / ATP-dependent DNA helicase PcrA